MFTETDHSVHDKAVVRLTRLRQEAPIPNYVPYAGNIRVAAQLLLRTARTQYRAGGTTEALIRLPGELEHTPGRTALIEQIEARIRAKLGKDERFNLDVRFEPDGKDHTVTGFARISFPT